MALSFKTQPSENYLVNNPIVFELKSNIQVQIRFDVTISGNIVYTGVFTPTGKSPSFEANISVSEIIRPYMQSSEVANMNQMISAVSNPYTSISVQFTQNSSTLSYSGRIYKGGIGKKMLRYLKGKNTDIFAYKLLSAEKQFFLTTRSSGRHIIVKENELHPLYFIATDKTYTVVTDSGQTFAFPAMTAGNLYAFNIEVLRRLSYNTYRKVPAYMGILVDGKYILDITVKKPAKSPHKYIIQFLNSFSAFEKLEVTGKALSEPEFGEDNAFTIYDKGIDDYIEQNNRLGIREVVKADFGYKTLDEFMFMRDMLQSDKRYLIDQSGNRHEIRVSVENFSHDLYPTEPGSIQLKIRLVDNDVNYSPDVDESTSDFNFGEAIWEFGVTNAYGFLYADKPLNTI